MMLSDGAIVGQTSFLRLASPSGKVYPSAGLRGEYQGQSERTSTIRPEQYGKER